MSDQINFLEVQVNMLRAQVQLLAARVDRLEGTAPPASTPEPALAPTAATAQAE